MPYAAGQEIDAFCTRCKIDNVHVIVAVWEGSVKKVQCRSCNHEHLYRRPLAAREKAARTTGGVSRAHKPPPLSAAQAWAQALSGRDTSRARSYSMRESFAAGDLVRHSSFGTGVVSRLVSSDKMEVVFEDGMKVLVQGKS